MHKPAYPEDRLSEQVGQRDRTGADQTAFSELRGELDRLERRSVILVRAIAMVLVLAIASWVAIVTQRDNTIWEWLIFGGFGCLLAIEIGRLYIELCRT